MSKLTSEVLDLAADKIQEHGWGQGVESWAGGGGGLCLEGGIAAAMGLSIDPMRGHGLGELTLCPAYIAVHEYLAEALADAEYQEPWFWNDRIAESVEDVIAVLRSAAAIERVKESGRYDDEDQPLPVFEDAA